MIELCNVTNEKKNSDSLESEPEPEIKPEKKIDDLNDQSWRTEKAIKKITNGVNKVDIPIPKSNHIPSFSIKDKLAGQQATKSEEISENKILESPKTEITIENQSFSELELIDKWQQFSDKLGDKPRIFNTLTSKEPKLEGEHTVTFQIDNNLQEEKINDIRAELLDFLRVELKNSKIELKLLMDESVQESKLYTSEEKFKHLLSKNEELGRLKQEFNLDFE